MAFIQFLGDRQLTAAVRVKDGGNILGLKILTISKARFSQVGIFPSSDYLPEKVLLINKIEGTPILKLAMVKR